MTTQLLHCRLNDKAEATIAQLTHTDCRNRFFFFFELSFILLYDFPDDYNAVENVGRRLEMKYKQCGFD